MVFAPFLLIYVAFCLFLLLGLFVLIELEVISYAFLVLGLPPRLALVALLVSFIGSYINIPLYTVEPGTAPSAATVSNFGVVYGIPFQYGRGTIVAVNVGGALVPAFIAAYALLKTPTAIVPSIIGMAIVAVITHHFAYPVRGLGIAVPLFIPPLVAALVAIFLGRTMRVSRATSVIAYVSGSLGTLIGADLLNLHRIADLGAPVASIGGAGTFDGVFLTGIVAILLAGSRAPVPKRAAELRAISLD
jgi:uncharacterized membrane protein